MWRLSDGLVSNTRKHCGVCVYVLLLCVLLVLFVCVYGCVLLFVCMVLCVYGVVVWCLWGWGEVGRGGTSEKGNQGRGQLKQKLCIKAS